MHHVCIYVRPQSMHHFCMNFRPQSMQQISILGALPSPSKASWFKDSGPMTIAYSPEGPSTQYLRTLVPNAIQGMAFGTRVLK